MLFAGYLKPVQLDLIVGRYYGKLAIPNQEVKLVYEDMFRNWLHRAAPSRAYIDDLVKAIFSVLSWGDAGRAICLQANARLHCHAAQRSGRALISAKRVKSA